VHSKWHQSDADAAAAVCEQRTRETCVRARYRTICGRHDIICSIHPWLISRCLVIDMITNLDPSSCLATIDMGRKLGGLLFWGGAGSPSNTVSLGPRPTSLPSGILIYPAICDNRYGLKIRGLCPFGEGQLGPYLAQCGQGLKAYLRAKFHFNPSNHLAIIHQCYRQTGQDDSPIAYCEPFYKRSPKNELYHSLLLKVMMLGYIHIETDLPEHQQH